MAQLDIVLIWFLPPPPRSRPSDKDLKAKETPIGAWEGKQGRQADRQVIKGVSSSLSPLWATGDHLSGGFRVAPLQEVGAFVHQLPGLWLRAAQGALIGQDF